MICKEIGQRKIAGREIPEVLFRGTDRQFYELNLVCIKTRGYYQGTPFKGHGTSFTSSLGSAYGYAMDRHSDLAEPDMQRVIQDQYDILGVSIPLSCPLILVIHSQKYLDYIYLGLEPQEFEVHAPIKIKDITLVEFKSAKDLKESMRRMNYSKYLSKI